MIDALILVSLSPVYGLSQTVHLYPYFQNRHKDGKKTDAILIAFGILALSLLIAGLLITRYESLLGIMIGLGPIIIMEVWLQSTQLTLSRQFIDIHCMTVDLPPGCTYGKDACAEENGFRAIFFWSAGFIDLILYTIGVVLLCVVHSHSRKRGDVRFGPLP
jgi:hypothetical protein